MTMKLTKPRNQLDYSISRLSGKVDSLLEYEFVESFRHLPLLVPQLREPWDELRLDTIPLVLNDISK